MEKKLTIVWSKKAEKDLAAIDNRYQQHIRKKIEFLGDISAPPLDLMKLSCPSDHYRLRVGDYRVIFTRRGEGNGTCYVVAIRRRTSTTYSLHEEPGAYEYSVY
jgi:Cytotoxic translational repressor of toxin-antitoxin stability system